MIKLLNLSARFALLLFCFGTAPAVFAQKPAGSRYPLETLGGHLGLQLAMPARPMRDAVRNEMGNIGFGAGLSVLSNPLSWGRRKRNSPFRVGGEAGYTYYGRFLSDVNIGGYRGSYKTSYGIMQLNGIVQLRPMYTESITPFLEVLAGGNIYLSNTRENLSVIESALGIPAFEIDSYASVGFNKGLAAGFTFGKPAAPARFLVRASYNVGSNIKYVVRNSLQYDPGSNFLSYQVAKAPVRYLLLQVGVAF